MCSQKKRDLVMKMNFEVHFYLSYPLLLIEVMLKYTTYVDAKTNSAVFEFGCLGSLAMKKIVRVHSLRLNITKLCFVLFLRNFDLLFLTFIADLIGYL
jgi:hypothetical protein